MGPDNGASASIHGVEEANLIAALEEAVQAGLPGISCAIATKSGVIWQGCAGDADIHTGSPIEERHLFGIGSITKVFMSVIALQLVEENGLDLGKTIGCFLACARRKKGAGLEAEGEEAEGAVSVSYR